MMHTLNPSYDRYKRSLLIWLFSGCFLVFGMVVVGGITRLTGSGLSITEWKVVTGTIPPLNEAQWMAEFCIRLIFTPICAKAENIPLRFSSAMKEKSRAAMEIST